MASPAVPAAPALLLLPLLLCAAASHAAHSTDSFLAFTDSFLAPHNAARREVGLPALAWDTKVAAYAAWYAALRGVADCRLEHSDGPYGENLFWGSGVGWDPADVVAAWLAEKPRYDYEQNSCRGGAACGHYTQIVWRNTTALGCALVACAEGRGTFGICSYDPPGNYVGERPY